RTRHAQDAALAVRVGRAYLRLTESAVERERVLIAGIAIAERGLVAAAVGVAGARGRHRQPAAIGVGRERLFLVERILTRAGALDGADRRAPSGAEVERLEHEPVRRAVPVEIEPVLIRLERQELHDAATDSVRLARVAGVEGARDGGLARV